MGWHAQGDEMGSVTRAWEEWHYVDQDQRTWTGQVLSWANEHYTREWDTISKAPGTPDGPDAVDLLFDRLGGLLPHEHEWLTLAATIRDAVSAYEVYLSKAFDEVLNHHDLARRKRFKTMRWTELIEIGEVLGVDVKPAAVRKVAELRNILTHQRGELRREMERSRYGVAQGYTSHTAVLTPEITYAHLDDLGRATRDVDPLAWAYSWGGLRAPALLPPAEADGGA